MTMRKLLNASLLFSSLLFVGVGCNKVTTDEPTKEQIVNTASAQARNADEPSLNAGIMTFQSEEHFGTYLSRLAEKSGEELTQWEESKGFRSSRTKFNNSLTPEQQTADIEEPLNRVLATVLNEKNIVRVNPWFFKLNPTTKKVYALSVSYANEISLLDSDAPSDSRIGVFNFDDDVFDVLDESPRGGCDEECAKGTNVGPKTASSYYCTGGSSALAPQVGDLWRHVRIKYDNAGIYESLYMRFQHKRVNENRILVWQNCSLVESSYIATFAKRCKPVEKINKQVFLNAANTAYAGIHTGTSTDDKDWNVYNGTRCLASYELSGKIYHFNSCINKIAIVDMGTIKSK